MKQAITVRGVTLKTPSSFKIERYNVTKSNRLASALMSMELIAKKRKFFCTWDAITSADMNAILNLIWETNDVFFAFTYVENNEVKTADVYTGAISTELYRTDVVDWVWKGVSINFIER